MVVNCPEHVFPNSPSYPRFFRVDMKAGSITAKDNVWARMI